MLLGCDAGNGSCQSGYSASADASWGDDDPPRSQESLARRDDSWRDASDDSWAAADQRGRALALGEALILGKPPTVAEDGLKVGRRVGGSAGRRDAIRRFMERTLAETERVIATPDQIFVAGDSAAFSWTVQLTTKHGRSVTFEGIDVIQVNDQGKIQTLHAYWDPAPVLAVLEGNPSC